MARYGMDYGNSRNFGNEMDRGGWNRGISNRNYDFDYGRGFSGRGGGWGEREGFGGTQSGRGGLSPGYGMHRGYDYDLTGSRGGGRGSFGGMRGGYDVGYRTGGYDRDFGDRVREGWQDLKQGARRMFGGGDDRHYNRGVNRDW